MPDHLFTETGRWTNDYWFCTDCPSSEGDPALPRDSAIEHVKITGHEVKVRHESEYTLVGVRQ